MPNKLQVCLKHPKQTIAFAWAFSARVAVVLLSRLLLPRAPRFQSLRTELQRAYLTSTSLNFPDLTFCLPAQYPSSDAWPIEGAGWEGYIIPGGADAPSRLASASQDANRRVILFAHGGGYARGTARMYTPYMKRWIAKAKTRGLEVCFVSVEYTLSTQASHPKQREEFISAYRYLLSLNIPPSQILFVGDSAGGGLSVISALHALRIDIPQPAGCILISPWLDMGARVFKHGSPTVCSDYFVQANEVVPVLARMFRGSYHPEDPQVNPLHSRAKDMKGLCPQLIFAGGAEFARYDTEMWVERCVDAEVPHRVVIEPGQLHIWAMGSAWIDPELRKKTDERIVAWMAKCV